jgi:hypothetical protein
MLEPADLKPLQRQALLAALDAPTCTLHRCRKGYAAQPVAATSGAQRVPVFTNRVVNQLERDGLVAFEPPQWPDSVTLTETGRALAQQLRAACRAKAGAA